VIPILAGMGCFLLPLAWDAGHARAFRALKWLCAVAAVALYLWAAVTLLADPWRFRPPLGVRIAAGACAASLLLLLVQSLLIEVGNPLKRAAAEGPRVLVTTGTYALVRHPGVLWYAFFHLLLGAASGSIPFLLATPVWAGLNTVVAAVQDRITFPRIFGEPYQEYRRAVPFLVPSRASLRRCRATVSLLCMRGIDH
jgi:protein-S-isoprenylcysteine O-methyltransferase Ste14